MYFISSFADSLPTTVVFLHLDIYPTALEAVLAAGGCSSPDTIHRRGPFSANVSFRSRLYANYGFCLVPICIIFLPPSLGAEHSDNCQIAGKKCGAQNRIQYLWVACDLYSVL